MPVAPDGRRAVDELHTVRRPHAGRRSDGGSGRDADGDGRFVHRERGRRRPVAIGEIAVRAVERMQASGEAAGIDDEVAGDAADAARAHLFRQRRQWFIRAVVEERAPGRVGPGLDDEVAVEDCPPHCAVRRQARQPAVTGAKVLEGSRHRHHLEHRGGTTKRPGRRIVHAASPAHAAQSGAIPRGCLPPARAWSASPPSGGRPSRPAAGRRGRARVAGASRGSEAEPRGRRSRRPAGEAVPRPELRNRSHASRRSLRLGRLRGPTLDRGCRAGTASVSCLRQGHPQCVTALRHDGRGGRRARLEAHGDPRSGPASSSGRRPRAAALGRRIAGGSRRRVR